MRAASEPKRLSAQAQLDAARAKLDQLFSRSEVNSGKSNPGQPLNPFTQDLQSANSEIVAAQSKLDNAKTKLDQLLIPTTSDLIKEQGAVAKAKGELAEVQEDVTKAISSHLDTGIMSGEEFDLWNLMLKAQSALQATRARILVQPSLLTEPTVAGKEVESASAGLVEDLGIVETNTQAISTYLKELISFSQIPEAIASAMAAESDKKPLWRLPKPRFRNLKTPTPTP